MGDDHQGIDRGQRSGLEVEMTRYSLKGSNMRFLSQVAIVASVLTVVSAAIFITTRGDNGSRAAEAKLGEPDSRVNGVFRPTPTQWASLTVQPVEMQTFRSEFPTEGKIAIDEDRATRIYSPYAGRIMKLLVAPGDRIQQGQLIFAIHANDSVETQKDFMAALTGLNKARSQLNLAKITEQRLGNLARDKAMPGRKRRPTSRRRRMICGRQRSRCKRCATVCVSWARLMKRSTHSRRPASS